MGDGTHHFAAEEAPEVEAVEDLEGELDGEGEQRRGRLVHSVCEVGRLCDGCQDSRGLHEEGTRTSALRETTRSSSNPAATRWRPVTIVARIFRVRSCSRSWPWRGRS